MPNLRPEDGLFCNRVGGRGCFDLFFLQADTYFTWAHVRGCPKRDQKIRNERNGKEFLERKDVRSVLIESKAIENSEVDIYMSSRYRVRTIIPFKENPVMNVYLFTKDELNTFLEGYDQYAEFIVSVEQAEAMA